jgi:hypothetical protein
MPINGKHTDTGSQRKKFTIIVILPTHKSKSTRGEYAWKSHKNEGMREEED